MDFNDQFRKDIHDRVHEQISDRMRERMNRWEERRLRRSQRSGASGIVIGGLIVVIGLLILLDNMGIVQVHEIWHYWPVLLIGVGVAKVLESRSPAGYIWGGVLALAGALMLLDNLEIISFDFNLIWPLLLIAFGLSMLVRSVDRKRYLATASATAAGPINDNSGCCNALAVFGGTKRRIDSSDFRGGEVTSVFGGVEFDLRSAGMTVDQALIDVNIVCGGLEVRVPDNWVVINRAMTVFGGVEDKTSQAKLDPNAKSPHLVITGSVILGGISLRN